MKTQVIKLDPHDDVISVRDKMSWTRAGRILLVFPHRARILDRTLDLRLLQRHAATLGAQLAIVSHSETLRRQAEGLKIPGFPRIASAQRNDWTRDRAAAGPVRRDVRPDLDELRRASLSPEAPWRNTPGVRIGFFSLAALAILAVFSLFIPSATILLTPAPRMENLTFPVSASSDVTSVNLAGSLPARKGSLIVERSKIVRSSGLETVPDQKAQGMVRFRNLTTAIAGIPAGTIIRSPSSPVVRFSTTTDAVAAAGIGKTVDVPVQAILGGSTGNLPVGSLTAIEGDLGTSLAVTNPDPTAGGTDVIVATPSSADRSHLRAGLVSDILAGCNTSLQDSLAPGDIFFPDTLGVSQVLSEIYFPAEGQSGDMLSLSMRVNCQAQYASLADILTLTRVSLDAALPAGYEPASEEITLLADSVPSTDEKGITHWDMEARRSLHARLDLLNAVQLVAGHQPSEAIARLVGSLPLAGSPVIKIQPGWWPWLPVVPLRITVSIAQ